MKKFQFLIIIILIASGLVALSFLSSKKPSVQEFQALSLPKQVEYLDQAADKLNILELRDFIKLAYPQEPNDRHELSHKLGELAVEQKGIEGFGYCDMLLQFGCFHGAALAAVRLRGNSDSLAQELWDACKSLAKFPTDCLHGLGHAVIMIEQYDVVAAYEKCEEILNENEAFWCEDGVSMENITRSMANAGIGAYGKLDDIHYPCNSIPVRFETPCVRNHIGYLYRNWGNDFSKAANFCFTYTGKTTDECIRVIGSIVSAKYNNNSEGLAKQCAEALAYRSSCVEGAVTAHSMSRRFDQAAELCDTLEADTDRNNCHGRVKQFLNN
jgi:hypothetical protein